MKNKKKVKRDDARLYKTNWILIDSKYEDEEEISFDQLSNVP